MVRDKPTLGTTIPANLIDQLSVFTGAFLYGKNINRNLGYCVGCMRSSVCRLFGLDQHCSLCCAEIWVL